MIIDKEKLIFIHIPKNAGTSINTYFSEEPVTIEIQGKKVFKHETIKEIKRDYFKIYNSYTKFAIIRNPYERMVSWYSYIRKYRLDNDNIKTYQYNSKSNLYEVVEIAKADIMGFRLWVKNPTILDPRNWLLNNQCYWIDKTVVLLRFENLNTELNKFFNKKINLPIKNATSKHNILDYYDKETSNIVYERYKEDFEKFNYKKL
jgi:hypothetical protein